MNWSTPHCVLIGERPKVADRRAEMVVRLADTLGVEPDRVAVSGDNDGPPRLHRPRRRPCRSGCRATAAARLTRRPRRRARRGSATRRPRDPGRASDRLPRGAGSRRGAGGTSPRTETACEAARSSGRARDNGGERTHPATRHPGKAHLAAEIHQRLRRSRPERAAAALDHAHDVGVHRQHRLAPREPAHRGRRVGADAGQPVKSAGQPSSATIRAARCSETARRLYPRPCHARMTSSQPGAGERFDRRPPLHPRLETWHHAADLRLLEHHLRDEHRVRVPSSSPGEISPVSARPSQEQLFHSRKRRRASGAHVISGVYRIAGDRFTRMKGRRAPRQSSRPR